MKKIILTESQLKMVRNNIINEESDNRYRRNVNVSISIGSEHGYKGMEINDVRPSTKQIELTYVIEQEQRSWGIKDISLYSIKGPDQIDVEIEFYPEGSDDYQTEEITIPLDWENSLYTNNKSGEGIVSVGDNMDIMLYISENGEYSVEMSIDVYTL